MAGKKEIYLPWDRFNKARYAAGYLPINRELQSRLLQFVNEFHPAPHKLNSSGLLLMMRNCHQILGYDLKSPVDFVVFYSPKFEYDGAFKICNCDGGTGFAVRLAYAHKIDCFPLEYFNPTPPRHNNGY